jgi:hypothetical protein
MHAFVLHTVLRLTVVLLFLVLSLGLLPLAALASEFILGGQILMYTTWDSTQVNANEDQFILRNNDPNFQHGRLKFSAERSRMYFLIKGPMLWGARTTGFIEFDFDDKANVNTAAGGLSFSPHKNRLSLRHAFFRLDWPETELLMGHYWSLLTEEIPEVGSQGTAAVLGGNPYFREPQIRLSQKFKDVLTVSLALSEPMNGTSGTTLVPDQFTPGSLTAGVANPFTGESSETPRVTGRLLYSDDLWGKAPYFGAPRGFTARLASSWQRSRFRAFSGTGRVFGQDNFTTVAVTQLDQQYLNQWIAEGSLFFPIIPTYTKELARTLSLTTQWYVGAGMDSVNEDVPASASYINRFSGINAGNRELLKRFGGFAQLQYYFTGSWYLNAVYGMSRAFGVNLGSWAGTTTSADPVKFSQQYYLTLWYRPIQALKLGLEYSYVRSQYFQATTVGSRITDTGENHHLSMIALWFF